MRTDVESSNRVDPVDSQGEFVQIGYKGSKLQAHELRELKQTALRTRSMSRAKRNVCRPERPSWLSTPVSFLVSLDSVVCIGTAERADCTQATALTVFEPVSPDVS